MASGNITRTPDYTLTNSEDITNDKINRVGGGTFRLDAGSVTDRELATSILGGFDTVAALRLNEDSFSNDQRVSVKGYFNADQNDFGPDVFADTSDTTTADDGLLCFVDTNGLRFKREFQGAVNIKNGGAVTTASADNTAIINACIATGNPVFVPEGTFEYSGLIDISDENRFYGVSTGSSVLKANHADARVSISSNSHISDIRIDGNDTAEFGLIAGSAASGIYVEHVRILNHTEAGLTLDGTQNSSFISLKISNNKRNVAICNDARNNWLLGIQTRYSSATIPSHADNRHLWAGEWVHAKLAAAPYGGNTIMRNMFMGGVLESEHGNNYAVEFYDGGLAGHGWAFYQTEFTSFGSVTAIIKVGSSFATALHFNDCKFEGTYAFDIGADQEVRATGCDYTGGGEEGKFLGSGNLIIGSDQLDSGYNMLAGRDAIDNTIFKYDIGDWVISGTATVAHNATTKVMDVTSPSTTGNSGIKVLPSRLPSIIASYDDRVAEVKIWIENNLAQREITAMDNSAETLTLDTTDWNANTDFSVGDAVIYREGDSAIGGLTDGTTYYVETVTTTTVTLETSVGAGAIDLTGSLPTGTHYLEFVDPNIAVEWVTYSGSYSTRLIGYATDGLNILADRLQGDEVGIQMQSQKLGGQSWSVGMVKALIH